MGNQATDKSLTKPRKKLFVDAKIQGALLAHTALYWSYCLLSVGVIGVAWIVLVKQPSTSSDLFQQLWNNVGPALVGAFMLLPLVLLDCLRLSNRFAGPMVRIQRCMKQLANGEETGKIKLRDSDFWCDFVNDLNKVIDQVALAKTASQPNGTHAEIQPLPEIHAVEAAPQPLVPQIGAPAALQPEAPVGSPFRMAPVTAANIYSDFA